MRKHRWSITSDFNKVTRNKEAYEELRKVQNSIAAEKRALLLLQEFLKPDKEGSYSYSYAWTATNNKLIPLLKQEAILQNKIN